VTTRDWEQVERLLDRWEEARRANRPLSAAELCADAPALRPELERRIAVLEWVLRQEGRPLSDSFADASLETARPPDESANPPPHPTRLKPGDEFDGLVLVRPLGRGGMGEVWEADEPRLNRKVAVKLIRPELAADPIALRRFAREALAHAAVQHENVLAIHTVGEFGGRPYLVMPLLEGEPLSVRLKREPALPVTDALRIGREMALGLAAVHARGLTHRDVKPGNVWLTSDDGPVKLLDFGLARTGDGLLAGEPVTRTGAVIGTPAYMAPEQADGREVDTRADLFSLGVVLYQTATGVNPFAADALLATMSNLANVTPPPPSSHRPELPPAFDELVLGLLQKRPDERQPATAREVAARLTAIEAGEHDATRVFVPRRPPRRWPLVAGGGLLLMVTAGLLAWRLWPAPAPPPPPSPDERVREVARRLTEQPIESFRVDETWNGVLNNKRRNEHTFNGTTGVPVYGRVRDGTVGMKVPYSGRYDRKTQEVFPVVVLPKGWLPPVPETKTVNGVISVLLAVSPDGVRLADYQQTETGGEVTDSGHNAQKAAKAAVLNLLRDVLPER
jgi:serine/threonine protein kinase